MAWFRLLHTEGGGKGGWLQHVEGGEGEGAKKCYDVVVECLLFHVILCVVDYKGGKLCTEVSGL